MPFLHRGGHFLSENVMYGKVCQGNILNQPGIKPQPTMLAFPQDEKFHILTSCKAFGQTFTNKTQFVDLSNNGKTSINLSTINGSGAFPCFRVVVGQFQLPEQHYALNQKDEGLMDNLRNFMAKLA